MGFSRLDPHWIWRLSAPTTIAQLHDYHLTFLMTDHLLKLQVLKDLKGNTVAAAR